MDSFTCPDINTGWKPVIREDVQDVEQKEPLLSEATDTIHTDNYGTKKNCPNISEILRLLDETERMIISVKRLLADAEGMHYLPCSAKTRARRKLRRRILRSMRASWRCPSCPSR